MLLPPKIIIIFLIFIFHFQCHFAIIYQLFDILALDQKSKTALFLFILLIQVKDFQRRKLMQ
jgi:hypothetical protein